MHRSKLTYLLISVMLLLNPGDSLGQKIYTVSGNSMEPAVYAGDRVIVDQPGNPLQRGDLVAIFFNNRERPILKRVVAVAGDRVELKNGKVAVNDQDSDFAAGPGTSVLVIQLERYNGVIPQNMLLVLGDNSGESVDSRQLGLIAISQVGGRVVRILSPSSRQK